MKAVVPAGGGVTTLDRWGGVPLAIVGDTDSVDDEMLGAVRRGRPPSAGIRVRKGLTYPLRGETLTLAAPAA